MPVSIPAAVSSRHLLQRWVLALVATAAGVWASFAGFDEPTARRGGTIAAACLALWLFEVVPPFVPTLLLLVAAPVALGPGFEPQNVLLWMADPVLMLFFGGFVLGEAATVHGVDRALASAALRWARGRGRRLIAGAAVTTAFLSMWMSNVAAAALMFACVQPLFPDKSRLGRAVLVAVAVGANLGGMATPISSGPNAIAIAAMDQPMPFLYWMAFGVPLAAGSIGVAVVLLIVVHRIGASDPVPVLAAAGTPPGAPDHPRPGVVGAIAAMAILGWVTEPLHGVPASVVSLGLAVVLFASGLVPAERLRHVDWSTLLLIAGGIGLGRLAGAAGLVEPVATALTSADHGPGVRLFMLVAASATLASVVSNTGSVALLIPLAVAVLPEVPTAPILIALGSSFGMPFVVSTPANAMAVAAGVPAKDLLLPGVVLLGGGCAVLAATGPALLTAFGLG